MSLLLQNFDLYNYQMHSLKSKNAYTYITLHKGQSNSHAWNDRSQWVTSWCGAVRLRCSGQKFRADFAVWRWIGFCSITLRSCEFYKIGNLFVAVEFSATTNFADYSAGARDRETFGRRCRCYRSFFSNRANGNKMSNFRGYLRRIVQKLWQCYVASSIYLPKKPIGTCRDILLRHTYFAISRVLMSKEINQSYAE